MNNPRDSALYQALGRQGRRLRRSLWNGTEHRPRALVRLVVGFLLVLVLAGIGNQYQPTVLQADGNLSTVVNMLSRQAPNAIGLGLAVVIAAVVVDRRRLTDLGLDIGRRWWHGLVGGVALGGSITVLSIVVGLAVGYYEVVALRSEAGRAVWMLFAAGAAVFQLLFVVPEELFVRGYLITNVVEGLNGVSSVSRAVAAGVGIIFSSVFFYLTHAGAKGAVFGGMVAILSVLLGLGYVFSGDLSVPIGIHFGINFAGVLGGTNPQQASILELSAATTVRESLVLPIDALVVRGVAAVLGIVVLCWWYHTTNGGLHVKPTVTRPVLRGRENRSQPDN